MPLAFATSTPSTPAPRPPLPVLSASAPAAVSTIPLPSTTLLTPNTSPAFGSASVVTRPDSPPLDMSVASVAPPTAPWTSRFFIDLEGGAPGLSPSLSPGYTRCTSEPPTSQPEMMPVRHQRSRSASRTPSLPRSGDSRTDLKSLPVTPKVTTPATTYIEPAADGDLTLPSGPASPFQPPLATSPPERGRSLKCPSIPHAMSHDALELKTSAPPRPPLPPMSDSTPVTPDERSEQEIERGMRPHVHTRSYPTYGSYSTYSSFGADAAALRSTQYTDLFLLEPHEYDSITDGELVRLFDRGVIDGRVLEQIVDASIRIQRACTDADRAVSIKTRRAMIRHALED